MTAAGPCPPTGVPPVGGLNPGSWPGAAPRGGCRPGPAEPEVGGGGSICPEVGGGGSICPEVGGGGSICPEVGGGGSICPEVGGGEPKCMYGAILTCSVRMFNLLGCAPGQSGNYPVVQLGRLKLPGSATGRFESNPIVPV